MATEDEMREELRKVGRYKPAKYGEVTKRYLGKKGEKLVKSYSQAGKRVRKDIRAKFKGGRKALTRRERGVRRFAAAIGALPGVKAGKAGAGRPKGTYKYSIGGRPVSVFEWRRFQTQRKRQLSQFQQQQNQRLFKKGFTPEQLEMLRQRQVIERVQEGRPMIEENVADQELAFSENLARTTITPNTQRILTTVRRIQNKGKLDNIEQQRRHFERRLVGKSMNLMKAHKNMIPVRLDFTGVNPNENILFAPSVFKEDPENFILKKRGRNILDTGENTLHF